MNFKMYNANYFFGVFQELLEVKTATKPVNWGFLRTPTSILNHVRHRYARVSRFPAQGQPRHRAVPAA